MAEDVLVLSGESAAATALPELLGNALPSALDLSPVSVFESSTRRRFSISRRPASEAT
jgi:hypothetical protein